MLFNFKKSALKKEDSSEVPPSKKTLITKKRILIITALLILVISPFIYLHFAYPTAPPLVSVSYLAGELNHHHPKMEKEVIGFLPYWRLDDSKYIRFDNLSEIIYFSLTADENGDIVKVDSGETDPGWRWWNSETIKDLIAKTQISGNKFSVSIAMQNNKTLRTFLDNKDAQQNLVNNLLKEVSDKHLDGINIDFEYAGIPDDSYRQKFTDFATLLSSSFHSQSPHTKLSIDLYPLSVREPKLFDIAKLSTLFDKYIVMSYDYYSISSDTAGPNAPMKGFKEKGYFFDITTTYDDYSKVIPPEKLIMGVPYYGWDWAVESGSIPLSKALSKNDRNGYPAVISYGRAKENKDLIDTQCSWDELAAEKWCWYIDTETNRPHQTWFEDTQSIAIKFDFAKSNNLGGVALWTLGYDKNYPDLWNLITEKFIQK